MLHGWSVFLEVPWKISQVNYEMGGIKLSANQEPPCVVWLQLRQHIVRLDCVVMDATIAYSSLQGVGWLKGNCQCQKLYSHHSNPTEMFVLSQEVHFVKVLCHNLAGESIKGAKVWTILLKCTIMVNVTISVIWPRVAMTTH